MSYTLPPIGFQLQTPDSQVISLTSAVLTNVIDLSSQAGIIHQISFSIDTVLTGNNTSALEVQIDGQATQSISLFSAALTFPNTILAFLGSGTGLVVNDFRTFLFTLPFTKSARIGLNVSIASALGALRLTVLRSKRI